MRELPYDVIWALRSGVALGGAYIPFWADPGIPRGRGSGSSKRQVHMNFQTDKQIKTSEGLNPLTPLEPPLHTTSHNKQHGCFHVVLGE